MRERFRGRTVADRFLAIDPWRQLDMRPFTTQSDGLAAALDELLKVLHLRVTKAELARSLVEEAFAYSVGRKFSCAIEAADAAHKPGPKVGIDAVSVADVLVRAYVLERSSVPATMLADPAWPKRFEAWRPRSRRSPTPCVGPATRRSAPSLSTKASSHSPEVARTHKGLQKVRCRQSER
jgi:hypothetical protein